MLSTLPTEIPTAESARALGGANVVACPGCGNPLRGRQRACSGRCRAKLSRERKATALAQWEARVRECLATALGTLDKGPKG